MFRSSLAAILFASVVLAPLPATASGEALDECVDLAQDHALRHNGAQFLYVRNGSDHYRLAFAKGSCNPMTMTSKLSLVTGEATGRICPANTRLRVRGMNCDVSRVEKISGEDYARRLRRR